MDSKGNSWVGNIFHKFESFCQEVDDFVSKDTVKYVENQVQSVGVSVKKIYSEVVRDILPPLGDDLKNNTQSMTDEHADMLDNVKSTTSNLTESDCVDERIFSLDQGSSDYGNRCHTSLSSDVDPVICGTRLNSSNSSTEVKQDVSLKLAADTMTRKDSTNSVEGKNVKGTIPFTTDSSSINTVLSMAFDDDNQGNQDEWIIKLGINSLLDLSVRDTELLAFKPLGSLDNSFSDAEYDSKTPRTCLLSESGSSLVQDVNLDKINNLPEPQEGSTSESPQLTTLALDPSSSSALDTAHTTFKKDGTHIKSFSMKGKCLMVANAAEISRTVFSHIITDNEETKLGAISSFRSMSSDSLSLLESTNENNIQTAENSHSFQAPRNGCGFYMKACPPSSSTVSHESMPFDTRPALSIGESYDSVVGSSRGSCGQCYNEVHSNILMLPSDDGNSNICAGISDLNMETIDLSSNVKCDALDRNFVRSSSYRKNFRYYKNLIQDAFASRKRLSKEYEYLPILYGDLDMDSKQHVEPSSLLSSPPSLLTARSPLPSRTDDSGWELL